MRVCRRLLIGCLASSTQLCNLSELNLAVQFLKASLQPLHPATQHLRIGLEMIYRLNDAGPFMISLPYH